MNTIQDIPIFDAHVHVWPEPNSELALQVIPGPPFPAHLDATPSHLAALMAQSGVARAALVNPSVYARDNRFLYKTVDENPDLFVGIGSLPIDPTDEDIQCAAIEILKGKVAGYRLVLVRGLALQQAGQGLFDSILSRAAEHRMPISLIYRAGMAYQVVERFAREFPDVKFVIDHMGHATAKMRASPDDQRALVALSRYPNVYVKLSLHHQLSNEDYPWRDLHDLQLRLIAAFGAERLMWGSNFPMFMPEPSYDRRLAALRDYFPFPTSECRSQILGGTAARLWLPPN